MVRKIEKELDENKQKAREAETEIIKVARELGLSPEPTGEGPSYWFARCPGKIHGKTGNHVFFINAATNSFGCGWCHRKGGVEELRAFVMEGKLGGVEKKEGRGPAKKEQQESKPGEALLELGYRLEKGHGFDQDYSKAMELYTLASAEGNSTGYEQHRLALSEWSGSQS